MGDLTWDQLKKKLERAGISPAVLSAMSRVPREKFVPTHLTRQSYENAPLPIGQEQTISQPLIVAHTTELAEVLPGQRILEVGTGSGYQTAVLLEMGAEVFTIERIPELKERAEKTLASLAYENVHLFLGDGFQGLPEYAPFDAIVLTAAPAKIPEDLIQQLAAGGILVGPEGVEDQVFVKIKKDGKLVVRETLFPVSFVPMLPGVAT